MSSQLHRAVALAATCEPGVTRETLADAADLLRAETITALGIECERVESSCWSVRWRGRAESGLVVAVTRYVYPIGGDRWCVQALFNRFELDVDATTTAAITGRGPTLRSAEEWCEAQVAGLLAALGGGA